MGNPSGFVSKAETNRPPLRLSLAGNTLPGWVPPLPTIWLFHGELPASWQALTESAFSASEQARYANMADAKKAEYLASRALLRLALTAHLAAEFSAEAFSTWALEERPEQAPGLQHDSRINIGLSHSHMHFAVALGDQPIGIDLEAHRQNTPRNSIAQRIFSPAQQAELAIATDPQAAFFRLWTQKEAAYKFEHTRGKRVNFFSKAPASHDVVLCSSQWRKASLSAAQHTAALQPLNAVEARFNPQGVVCEEICLPWIA